MDIVLELRIQHGLGFLPRDKSSSGQYGQFGDAQIAGRWYYRRCQSLALQMESPILTTVQCYLYTSVYLCLASFVNMAHATMSFAIRTAQILGLHRDPPEVLTLEERELQKRAWWALVTEEKKMSMKLGRRFSFLEHQRGLSHPSEHLGSAPWS